MKMLFFWNMFWIAQIVKFLWRCAPKNFFRSIIGTKIGWVSISTNWDSLLPPLRNNRESSVRSLVSESALSQLCVCLQLWNLNQLSYIQLFVYKSFSERGIWFKRKNKQFTISEVLLDLVLLIHSSYPKNILALFEYHWFFFALISYHNNSQTLRRKYKQTPWIIFEFLRNLPIIWFHTYTSLVFDIWRQNEWIGGAGDKYHILLRRGSQITIGSTSSSISWHGQIRCFGLWILC